MPNLANTRHELPQWITCEPASTAGAPLGTRRPENNFGNISAPFTRIGAATSHAQRRAESQGFHRRKRSKITQTTRAQSTLR